MKRTVVIAAAAALLVAAVAVVVVRSVRDSASEPTPAAASAVAGHDDVDGEAVIAGAEQVHAVTFLPDGALLLGAHTGLYRSEDAGRSWQEVDVRGDLEGSDFMSLVPHPSEPGTVFAAGRGIGVVKSTDAGVTWERSDEGIDGTDIHALAVNQRQSRYMYAYSAREVTYRSTDGGATWNRVADGPDDPDVRSLAYMAVQTDMDQSMESDNWGLVFAGTTSGLYDSYSCFCGWQASTDRFDRTTVHSLATLQAEPSTVYAGTGDGLWRSTDEGTTWNRLDGPAGPIAAVAIDPDDPRHVVALTPTGEMSVTTDAGRHWQDR